MTTYVCTKCEDRVCVCTCKDCNADKPNICTRFSYWATNWHTVNEGKEK